MPSDDAPTTHRRAHGTNPNGTDPATFVVYTTETGSKYHRRPGCANGQTATDPALEIHGGEPDFSGLSAHRVGESELTTADVCQNCGRFLRAVMERDTDPDD